MWQLLAIPPIGVFRTLCVWNLLSLATACTSLTNVAGGQRISATRKGDYENPPSYPMEFSPLVYFDETDYNSASCLNASEYKWSVNLPGDSVIQHVLVMSFHNTSDLGSFELGVGRPCCSGRIAAQEICISVCNNTDVDVYPSEQHQSALSSYPTLYVYRVTCLDDVGKLTGSHVTLSHASRPSPTQETICGLKVIGCEAGAQNMALGKPTQQSSNYWTAYSHLAVDGDRWQSQFYGLEHRCTHTLEYLDTKSDLPSWWRVDLERSVLVSYVLIYNRDDDCHCENRLHNFAVEFGFEDASGEIRYEECYFHPGAAGSVVNITCLRPMCARYVRIIKEEGDVLPLTLCEVEVYRVSGSNVPANSASTADPEENSATDPMELSSYSSSTGSNVPANSASTADPEENSATAPMELSSYSSSTGSIVPANSASTADPEENSATAPMELSSYSSSTGSIVPANSASTADPEENSATAPMGLSSYSSSTGSIVPANSASTADPEENSATAPMGLSTTQEPPASDRRPPAGSCKCRCVRNSRLPEAEVTSAEKEAAAEKLAKELLWEAPESKGTRFRKKNSMPDQRSSSKYMAAVSLFLVAAVCAVVVLPDVVSLVYFVVTRMRDRRGRVAGRRGANEA